MRLPRAFFDRDTVQVARELLGCTLVHVLQDGTRLSGRIVETEAYLPGDTASHGYRGETARNAPMFMRAGTAYVYFIYGMHFCFNVVTEGEGVPAAVLIRAVRPADGVEVMRSNRQASRGSRCQTSRGSRSQTSRVFETREVFSLTNGPGKLCQAFAIDRRMNGIDLCRRGSRLFIGSSQSGQSSHIDATPRIGIRGDETAKTALLRFVLRDA